MAMATTVEDMVMAIPQIDRPRALHRARTATWHVEHAGIKASMGVSCSVPCESDAPTRLLVYLLSFSQYISGRHRLT